MRLPFLLAIPTRPDIPQGPQVAYGPSRIYQPLIARCHRGSNTWPTPSEVAAELFLPAILRRMKRYYYEGSISLTGYRVLSNSIRCWFEFVSGTSVHVSGYFDISLIDPCIKQFILPMMR